LKGKHAKILAVPMERRRGTCAPGKHFYVWATLEQMNGRVHIDDPAYPLVEQRLLLDKSLLKKT
jgi:hypothetical protein